MEKRRYPQAAKERGLNIATPSRLVIQHKPEGRLNAPGPVDTSLFQRFHSLTIYRNANNQQFVLRLRQVKEAIVKAIRERTNQVDRLDVRVKPGKVVVYAETQTYYQRQLIDITVMHYIKRFAGEFAYDSRVLVKSSSC